MRLCFRRQFLAVGIVAVLSATTSAGFRWDLVERDGVGRVREVEFAEVARDDLAVRLEMVSEAPLPFQAARLRLSIENVSQRRLGPLAPITQQRHLFRTVPTKSPHNRSDAIRGAFGEEHSPRIPVRIASENIIVSEQLYHPLDTPNPLRHLHKTVPFYLEPGERAEFDYAVAAHWAVSSSPPKQPSRALFAVPGHEELRSHVQPGADPYQWCEGAVVVKVGEPAGIDAEAARFLSENELLQLTVLHPLVSFLPTAHAGPRLSKFQEQFAETRYADYARFALARDTSAVGIQPTLTAKRRRRKFGSDASIRYRPSCRRKLCHSSGLNRFRRWNVTICS